MGSLRRNSTRRYRSAVVWPEWTDEVRVELGPDPADAAWWASQNTDWHSDNSPSDILYDLLADEAAAQDRIERGLSL